MVFARVMSRASKLVTGYAATHRVIRAVAGRARRGNAEADDVGEAVCIMSPICVVRDLFELVEVDQRHLTRSSVGEGDEFSKQFLTAL